jgi:hypothetical protein
MKISKNEFKVTYYEMNIERSFTLQTTITIHVNYYKEVKYTRGP